MQVLGSLSSPSVSLRCLWAQKSVDWSKTQTKQTSLGSWWWGRRGEQDEYGRLLLQRTQSCKTPLRMFREPARKVKLPRNIERLLFFLNVLNISTVIGLLHRSPTTCSLLPTRLRWVEEVLICYSFVLHINYSMLVQFRERAAGKNGNKYLVLVSLKILPTAMNHCLWILMQCWHQILYRAKEVWTSGRSFCWIHKIARWKIMVAQSCEYLIVLWTLVCFVRCEYLILSWILMLWVWLCCG